MEVESIKKAATFISFNSLVTVLLNIFMRQTLTSDFGGYTKI